jgi:molybdenum cofactor cytidylyltransferase
LRAAIVLAAGRSRRFGRRDKLAARLGGLSLLDRALICAVMSGARRVIVVHKRRGTCSAGFVWIKAPESSEGMGGSLRAALRALRPIDREVLVFLGDMPFARVPHTLRLTVGRDALRPIFEGKPGHPTLVRTAAAKRLVPSGDRGLAAVLDPRRVGVVRGGPGNMLDIDTPAMLRAARMDQARSARVRSSDRTRSMTWKLPAGSRPPRR